MQGESNDGDTSDDDDDDSGWLTHSTFELRPPPVTRQQESERRVVNATGFDVRVLFPLPIPNAHKTSRTPLSQPRVSLPAQMVNLRIPSTTYVPTSIYNTTKG